MCYSNELSSSAIYSSGILQILFVEEGRENIVVLAYDSCNL